MDADREKVINAISKKNGGSFLRGWRRELDPDGSLDIDFLEFCQVMFRLGLAVDATLLFGEDSPDSMSLDELHPEIGELVYRFRMWTTEKFGSPGDMYMAFESGGLGDEARLSLEEFVEGCQMHGFEARAEDLGEIFALLDIKDIGSVEMEDVLFLDTDPKRREGAIQKVKMKGKVEQERLLSKLFQECRTNPMPPGHRLELRPWNEPLFKHLPEVVISRRMRWARHKWTMKAHARATFTQHMKTKYGNNMRAWRRGLDPIGSFKLSRQDLGKYCRVNNLELSMSSLWQSLDVDECGEVRLEEIAGKPAAALARFSLWSRNSFGTCAIWKEIMKVAKPPTSWKSTSSLTPATFIQALCALYWPGAGDLKGQAALTAALDLNGCGIMSRSDLDWLEKWDPPAWLCMQPDQRAWQKIRALLLKMYGRPLRAWRAIDLDDTNMISWQEFVDVCDQVGFNGNRGGAWRHLDEDISGTITLFEFDKPSAEILESFKNWIDSNFGSVEYAFKTMDTDGSGTLSYAELARYCKRLQWEGDVRNIFECLNVDMAPGAKALSYAEVGFLDSWQPNLVRMEEEILANALRPKTTKRSSISSALAGELSASKLLPPAPLAAGAQRQGMTPLARTSSAPGLLRLEPITGFLAKHRSPPAFFVPGTTPCPSAGSIWERPQSCTLLARSSACRAGVEGCASAATCEGLSLAAHASLSAPVSLRDEAIASLRAETGRLRKENHKLQVESSRLSPSPFAREQAQRGLRSRKGPRRKQTSSSSSLRREVEA